MFIMFAIAIVCHDRKRSGLSNAPVDIEYDNNRILIIAIFLNLRLTRSRIPRGVMGWTREGGH
jgi:hypothetical protein